jgi:hypothetical protein
MPGPRPERGGPPGPPSSRVRGPCQRRRPRPTASAARSGQRRGNRARPDRQAIHGRAGRRADRPRTPQAPTDRHRGSQGQPPRPAHRAPSRPHRPAPGRAAAFPPRRGRASERSAPGPHASRPRRAAQRSPIPGSVRRRAIKVHPVLPSLGRAYARGSGVSPRNVGAGQRPLRAASSSSRSVTGTGGKLRPARRSRATRRMASGFHPASGP